MTLYNVKAAPFNAVGDGVNDDTPAIQAALNAAVPGDAVYFPVGTYRSRLVTAKSGTAIFGDHREASTLLQDLAAPADEKLLDIVTGATGMEIYNLGFDGQGAAKSYDAEGELIHCTHLKNSRLHDLLFNDAVSEAMDLDKATDCFIERVLAYDCGGNVVHSGAAFDSERLTVRDVSAWRCSKRRGAAGVANAYAIHASGRRDTIENAKLYDCENGISTIGSLESKVLNSCVEGGKRGINGQGASVIGNVVRGCTERGIISADVASLNDIFGEDVTSVGLDTTAPNAEVSLNRIFATKNIAASISSVNAVNGSLVGTLILQMTSGYAVHFNGQQPGWLIDGNQFGGRPVVLPPDAVLGANRP